MPGSSLVQPPEAARFSGLYRFIPPDTFAERGIDPEDVPLGTFPAENHPPFLPDRYGGNAYGLGLFEQSVLPVPQARLLESLDLENPGQVAAHYQQINQIFKRLGLLIRYSQLGTPFYLIPRQFVAHFLVEIQARVELICEFLSGQLSRRLRESLKVGLVTNDSELLLPELKARMPHLSFTVMSSLAELTRMEGTFEALIMVGDPREFALAGLHEDDGAPKDREQREAYGFFMGGRLWDLLEEGGELVCLADRPLGSSRENLKVSFRHLGDFKRFLMFSHLYRTRRRYKSSEGMKLKINRFDFHAFLAGMGVYYETVEGLLDGRGLAQVEPGELDELPYQDLPLPRGSAPQLMSAWKRWLGPFFPRHEVAPDLPMAQKDHWQDLYDIDGKFPPTLVVFRGKRRAPGITLAQIQGSKEQRFAAGCSQNLLAGYRDTFAYVAKVLKLLVKIRDGQFKGIPGLELSRLRKPFESARRHGQLEDVFRLMELLPRWERLEMRLNPDNLLGRRTPVIANLEKLGLLGLDEGLLKQINLIVLGHSTLSRVTFGKLPKTSLRRITDPGLYRNLDEAVSVLRLYRLMSLAEAAAASATGLSSRQVEEMFALFDDALRVVSDPELDWEHVMDARISSLGGVRALAVRKMLKLFDLFDFLDNWRELEGAGAHEKEALADFDPRKFASAQQAIGLTRQVNRFVDRFYTDESAARPYFFRVLLNCEMHGTGRLLPRLGTAAGFTLLWICVHMSQRRVLNFNSLLDDPISGDLDTHLDKLRRALTGLLPNQLSPGWLAGLRQAMTAKSEVYVLDSGLYLTLDEETGALAPHFMDPRIALDQLESALEQHQGTPLEQVDSASLAAMDQNAHNVARFLTAQGMGPNVQSKDESDLAVLYNRHRDLDRRWEAFALRGILHLPSFAANLDRLVRHCPRLMDRLLPQPAESHATRRRLAAAAKLSAIANRSLEDFQDMMLSHEAARAEFGPATAGIVGVSPLQFGVLSDSLGQVLEKKPGLERLMMLSVLLYPGQKGQIRQEAAPKDAPLIRFAELAPDEEPDLAFLMEHLRLFWGITSGEACLMALEDLAVKADPLLNEALFLLSVVTTAAQSEGLFSEDMLNRFFRLQQTARRLSQSELVRGQTWRDQIMEQARRYVGLGRYLEIQDFTQPGGGLSHFLETAELPETGRGELLGQGRLLTGLERLLRLRRLLFVSALDLLLMEHGSKVSYIYRLKGLHSMGETHFERDLYEARRIHHGLKHLGEEQEQFVLKSLTDPGWPLVILGFAQAAELLTYNNQMRLLLAGLAGARRFLADSPGPAALSFLPLAQVIERKFELANQAITSLKPEAILNAPKNLDRMLGAKEGLTFSLDPEKGTLSLDLTELTRFERKIEAVTRAKTPAKLKRLYHQELRKLKLTTHSTLDYQRRLDAAFSANLDRLAREMLERVRANMADQTDLDKLMRVFAEAWEEGLELPLGPDRQQILRDLLELNVERLRGYFLSRALARLADTKSLAELDKLWKQVKQRLVVRRRHLGKQFELTLARHFDQRARELRAQGGPER